MKAIAAPIDFVGINNYTRADRRRASQEPRGAGKKCGQASQPRAHRARLGGLPGRAVRGAHPPQARVRSPSHYMTENGAAFADVGGPDGGRRRPRAHAYIKGYVGTGRTGIADGVPLRGYFVWSLIDNFEWATATPRRFGIVYVDYPTLERSRSRASAGTATLIALARAAVPAAAASSRSGKS